VSAVTRRTRTAEFGCDKADNVTWLTVVRDLNRSLIERHLERQERKRIIESRQAIWATMKAFESDTRASEEAGNWADKSDFCL
jgi:hypothetical protein